MSIYHKTAIDWLLPLFLAMEGHKKNKNKKLDTMFLTK